ncbi:MAG: capsid protein [Gemycircularvirus ansal1]|uniref:Capsid protein n=1 Tax=Genomoviridae sp. TaxID=2202565 RepID=A0A6M3YNC8_9VIRU|nr:MAG: capsid protein [Genomoviridae sp.]QJI53411.1 MAG: capsid protein [Genomoviridae sp.]QJI53413.1 MAG: capsid protein [Genomoviridae sp.]QJI53415.1 MAG: capsid protein [Genomoviridae sp.]QJI53455.1 MAG: capsid protein [Genomoviridae sp.]QJI53457.1 MAG: capsid protein [Genomoviridae sp.]
MPYLRKPRYVRRRFTSYRGVRKTRSFAPRSRYSVRKRTTSRRTSGMSRKRLLNITSRKKQDTMLVSTNTVAGTPVGGTTFTNQPALLQGGNTYVFPWLCTARDNTVGTDPGSVFQSSDRTASTCFMRGLKERIQIQTNSGVPWQWRRICFTIKGDYFTQFNESGYKLYNETSIGWSRVVSNAGVASNIALALRRVVFRGQEGNDWNNLFNAKVDNTRVSLKYDKTTSIRSGNASGMMREFNRWHPMNKNLVYDDDEDGSKEAESLFSTQGKAGMGDYYVLDIISAGTGATTSDQMTFNPSSTLYWHER